MVLEVRHAVPSDAGAITVAHVEAWRVAYAHVVPRSFLDDPRFGHVGDDVVEDVWPGPAMPGMAPFDSPLAETQYRRSFPA